MKKQSFENFGRIIADFAHFPRAIVEPIAYLARPLDNPSLDRYTSRVRSRFDNRPINKRDSVLEGLAILDGGGNLGLLADVNTLQRDGVLSPSSAILPAPRARSPCWPCALTRSSFPYVACGIQTAIAS